MAELEPLFREQLRLEEVSWAVIITVLKVCCETGSVNSKPMTSERDTQQCAFHMYVDKLRVFLTLALLSAQHMEQCHAKYIINQLFFRFSKILIRN